MGLTVYLWNVNQMVLISGPASIMVQRGMEMVNSALVTERELKISVLAVSRECEGTRSS